MLDRADTRCAIASTSGRKVRSKNSTRSSAWSAIHTDLVGVQARIQRVQHARRNRRPRSTAPCAGSRSRPASRRARRARRPNAASALASCARTLAELAVGVAMQVAFDAARHDLLRRRDGARRGVSSVEISSGCCIIPPIIGLPRARCQPAARPRSPIRIRRALAPNALHVASVAARDAPTNSSADTTPRRGDRGQSRLEAEGIRQRAGEERADRQAEQVLEQRQHRGSRSRARRGARHRSRPPTPAPRCRSSGIRPARSARTAPAARARSPPRARRTSAAAPASSRRKSRRLHGSRMRAGGRRRNGRRRRPTRTVPAAPHKHHERGLDRRPGRARCRGRGSR